MYAFKPVAMQLCKYFVKLFSFWQIKQCKAKHYDGGQHARTSIRSAQYQTPPCGTSSPQPSWTQIPFAPLPFVTQPLPEEAIIKKLLLSLPLHSEAGVSVFRLASLETTHPPPCHRSHTPCSDLLNSQHHLNTPPRTVSSKTQVLRIMSNMQFEDSD